MKKKIILCLLSCFMVLSLFTACGSSDESGVSKDEERFQEIENYIKEGNYDVAKSLLTKSRFDNPTYYYLANNDYLISQKKYGEAFCNIGSGLEDREVKENEEDLNKLNDKLDEITTSYGDKVQKTRDKERESYLEMKEELDDIQKQIDDELEKYYNDKSSKAKLLRLHEKIYRQYKQMAYIKCDGYTNEYSTISKYESYVKKQINYIEDFAEKKVGKDVKVEAKLLEAQEYAKQYKTEFEEIIKEDPKLY